MNWLNERIAAAWRAEGRRYADNVNAFVRRSMAGEQPDESEIAEDQRKQWAKAVWEMVKKANEAGEISRLREELPAATWPMAEAFDKQMQPIRAIGYLHDGSIVFSSGSMAHQGRVYTANRQGELRGTAYTFAGCSADQLVWALASADGIHVVSRPDGALEGERLATYRWGDIQDLIHEILPNTESFADCEFPERTLELLVPLEDGKALLLQSYYGIYLIEPNKVELLHPDLEDIEEYELEDTRLDMGHAAVSRDGTWIAYGSQASEHMLLNRRQGQKYMFYPESSYPHYAVFSGDNRNVWFNSCHFYNGVTIRIPLEEAEGNEKREDWPIVDEHARMYAAVEVKEGIVVGDAYGYLRCIDQAGQEQWRYYVGGTIFSLATSPDRSELLVGTYSGMLHVLDLASPVMDEYSIGTGTLRERERFVLLRGENPVRW
ncbi:PQQ-binding-like beta-propeller repeat protein [Paenibacillus hubeiensis]|uniref:PQQ-binding-like beta-propeller repeat protein n=1 Tax=Paenibacillus hubeiensis TaxID=3077330 RepID=UPI0031BBAC4F